MGSTVIRVVHVENGTVVFVLRYATFAFWRGWRLPPLFFVPFPFEPVPERDMGKVELEAFVLTTSEVKEIPDVARSSRELRQFHGAIHLLPTLDETI